MLSYRAAITLGSYAGYLLYCTYNDYELSDIKKLYNSLALSSHTEQKRDGSIARVLGSVALHHQGDIIEGNSSIAHSR